MRKTWLSALFIGLVSCGGPTPGATNTNTSPDAASTATPTSEHAEDAATPRASIDSQREPFVQGCMAKLAAPEYCNCAFDQFRDVFKDVDLSVKPSEAQLASVKERTRTTCAAKLPEDAVKQSFTAVCVSGESRKAPYCDCAWAAYRKRLDLADFLSDFEGAKFEEAKKSMSLACKGKLPEEVAKADFIGGCTKSAPSQGKTCECVWKKLRAKTSVDDIAAGLVDLKSIGIESCRTP